MENKKKNNFIIIIVLAVVFGMGAGIVGDLVARVYILKTDFNIPFYGEIDFSNGSYRESNIIIREPKNVIVKQNDKVIETINSVQSSLVGIYKKNLLNEETEKVAKELDDFNLGNYYKLRQAIAQGLIITSDGWIVTDFIPENLNYVVITQDKKIYSIDKIVSDTLTKFHFLHVQAKDFPVRKFAEFNDIKNGQLLLAVNWDGTALLNSIVNKDNRGDNVLFFSDVFISKIKLADNLTPEFSSLILFNLSGDVVGLSLGKGIVEPIYHFTGAIQSLLKNKVVKRPSLGVNYVDLSSLVSAIPTSSGQASHEKGALIYRSSQGISVLKNSAAQIAGLKEGDIIISVDGREINQENNLTEVIQSFMSGDKVNITYLRDGKESQVELSL